MHYHAWFSVSDATLNSLRKKKKTPGCRGGSESTHCSSKRPELRPALGCTQPPVTQAPGRCNASGCCCICINLHKFAYAPVHTIMNLHRDTYTYTHMHKLTQRHTYTCISTAKKIIFFFINKRCILASSGTCLAWFGLQSNTLVRAWAMVSSYPSAGSLPPTQTLPSARFI